ncbi:MAG: hypothetical protein Q9186_004847 [Xanthomendoza sp. 1 TL-2023]
MTSQDTKTVKTRFCIISDTHTAELWPLGDTSHAYRDPLPSADVLLHAGDITNFGYIHEYETMVDLLSQADAELKIVIAGNHDVTLDEEYYESTGKRRFHRNIGEDLTVIKELWTGEKARKAGIVYLEEGIRMFTLTNGARFTIYTSPYQPEFCNWAFPYYRNEDRFNPGAKNPIPDWPHIDIMLTHGPPAGVLDETNMGDKVGCEHLMRAPQATGSLFLDPHSIPGYGVGGTPTDEHPYRGNIPDIEANPEWSQAIREAWLFHCFAPATADEFIAMHTESRKKLANAQETHEQQMRGLTDSKAYQCILRREEQDLVETSPDDKETHEDLLRRLRNNRDEYQHLAKQIFETREIGEKTYAVYVSLRKRGQEIIDTHKHDVRISREDSYNVIHGDGGAKPSIDGHADAQKVPEHVATDDQGPQRSAAAQERSPR